MSNLIGPTFGRELEAANARTDGLSYNLATGELTFTGSDWTAQQESAVQAVFAAHDPTKQTQQQLLAEKIATGYVDATLGVTLAIDETSQQRITSVGAAAGIAVATNSTSGKTFIFPTLGAPYTAASAQSAYDLSERCREYVQGLIVAAEAGTLTP